ncbi:hypothetical protein M2168_002885 [Streptomyces sp. CZ24]|nr:hypothetical protein [Streptomyces sp. CZ24]
MTSRFTELTVDCEDPEGLAEFWCAVLDFQVIDSGAGKAEIGSWVPTAEEVRARQMPRVRRAAHAGAVGRPLSTP